MNQNLKVEIGVSCKNLTKMDALSKSDPKVFLFLENRTYTDSEVKVTWEKIGSTERIKNEDNPIFTKNFYVDYYFERIQKLRFVVVDMDNDSDDFSKNEFIGYCEKTIGDLIGGREDGVYTTQLSNEIPKDMSFKNSKGKKSLVIPSIIIRIKEVVDSGGTFVMDISGIGLDKKDKFGKSDPFIIVSRIEDDHSLVKVYETSVIKNTLDPKWTNIEIPEIAFNSCNPDRMLLWEVYDWDKNSDNDLIGIFRASARMIMKQKKFEIINDKKKAKKEKYTNSGVMVFDRFILNKDFKFMDFIMGGTEIAVSFALDFTGSNGRKESPKSLHYNSPNYNPNDFYSLNEYQKAISSLGYVLEPYDSTRYMEIYGYGARFFNRPKVEFQCSLTGDENNPSVHGVAGILETYHKALQTAVFSGPTNFSPIIRKITEEARKSLLPPNSNNPLKKYYVLTIITDGIISDMDRTKEALIEAFDAPLSIIIVGVGTENFEKMKELDSDDGTLKIGKKVSKRDIVQFVPLANYIMNPTLLAQETLKEIPKQIYEFTSQYQYKPPIY